MVFTSFSQAETGRRSGALPFFSHPPERTQSEPGKRQGEANRHRYAAGPCLSGVIFPVLLHAGAGKAESHDEENHPRQFQPQLVHHVAEGATGGANSSHQRAEGAVAPSLLAGNASHDTQLAQCGDFTHNLDFSSLRSYNVATLKRQNRSADSSI